MKRPSSWAAANGIVTGTDSTSFSPDAKVTREQLAAILYRYAQYRKLDTDARRESWTASPTQDSVSGYASEALGWAVSEGLINGASGRAHAEGRRNQSTGRRDSPPVCGKRDWTDRITPICSTGLPPFRGQPCLLHFRVHLKTGRPAGFQIHPSNTRHAELI